MSKALIMVSDAEATFLFQQAQGEAASAPAFDAPKTFKGENNSTVTVKTVSELEEFLISSGKLLTYAKLAERPADPIKGPIWDHVTKMATEGQSAVLEITGAIRDLTNLPNVDVPMDVVIDYSTDPNNILDEATIAGAWAKSVSTPATGEEIVAALESATAPDAPEATEPATEESVSEEQPAPATVEETPASVEQLPTAQDEPVTDAPVAPTKEPNPAMGLLESNADMFQQISVLTQAVSSLSAAAAQQTRAAANAIGQGVEKTLEIGA